MTRLKVVPNDAKSIAPEIQFQFESATPLSVSVMFSPRYPIDGSHQSLVDWSVTLLTWSHSQVLRSPEQHTSVESVTKIAADHDRSIAAANSLRFKGLTTSGRPLTYHQPYNGWR
jgi:hypothetical protein